MPNVSMCDVAAKAGVSTATVSHVINNTRYVSDETRQRVMEAIQVLNYNPNAMARIFRTGHKGIVGFVIPDISNPFFSELIEVVENVLGQHNYRLLLSNSHEDTMCEIENMRMMTSGIVDGVLVASSLQDYGQLNDIVPEGFPMVFLDRSVPNCPYDTVRVNTYDAVLKATEELIQAGHTNIACFGSLTHLSTALERINAYETALRRYGLEPKIIPLPLLHVDLSPLLEQTFSTGITALVATNSRTTRASLEYIYQHGMTLGKDIELVAFQDEKMPHFFFSCGAAIRQPIQALGEAAAQQMLYRISDPTRPIQEIVLEADYLPKTSELLGQPSND